MEEDVIIFEVLQTDVVDKMQVPVYPANDPITYFAINFQTGLQSQILESLISLEDSTYEKFKYPLIAALMPISEVMGSGFLEVTFPRIVIAFLTKTGDDAELVKDKYNAQSVYKNILRPILKEFIKRLAWSTFTSMGDPDAYEYSASFLPCKQPIGKGLNDFVEVIEVTNLKAIFFPTIKSC